MLAAEMRIQTLKQLLIIMLAFETVLSNISHAYIINKCDKWFNYILQFNLYIAFNEVYLEKFMY